MSFRLDSLNAGAEASKLKQPLRVKTIQVHNFASYSFTSLSRTDIVFLWIRSFIQERLFK
jgi:hypothetical protein